ncbi:hypothetical protein Hypma_007824 [Hypsizygus marmoreus]|uniref:Essential protein Yae1 N-terminal domain-containing protein n=1 Tax=Hypsizygus marmoreus TaxID=39966 RepID=A0A369K171_HYPMA|nr:hypothetical protein Hypma_007824 [Hypsizygus marmoreus]
MPVENTAPQSNSQFLEVPEPQNQGLDVVAKLREVTSSPSPLTRLLQDPSLESSRSKHRSGRRNSRSPHRERRSPSLMTLALVEEERQGNHLKALLRNATDRLEYEIRRADEAEARAIYAESREKEVSTKLIAAESIRRQMESDLERSNAENRRYQMQLENGDREQKRLKANLLQAEKLVDELEEANSKAKESSRYYQNLLLEHRAHEEGREEGRQIAMQRCFEDGRDEGWVAGNDEGFEEGRKAGFEDGRRTGRKEGLREGREQGRIEGLREGREQGRIEERRNALEAFDRFLNEEMDDYDDGVSVQNGVVIFTTAHIR